VANKAMLEEYARVLSYKKFSLAEEEIAAIFDEEIFPYFSVVRTPSRKIPHPPKDEKDVPFLQAAADGGAQYVITGAPPTFLNLTADIRILLFPRPVSLKKPEKALTDSFVLGIVNIP
jgi:predicted nucleic acid-binding protein